MKKMICTMFLSFLTMASFSQGLNFENQDLKGVLSSAKASKKPVLLVAFAENELPLQMLISKTLYPDSVSKALNSGFICSLLYSKSIDGKAFLDENNVFDFPAVLILNSNGEMVAKHIDLRHVDNPNVFFNVANLVLEDNRLLKKFEKEYSKNKHNSAFLKSYVYAKLALQDPNQEILDAYLKSLSETELNSPDVLQLFVQNADLLRENTFASEFLLKTYAAANNADKKALIQFLLNKVALNTIKFAALYNNPKKIDEAKALYGVDPVTSSTFVSDFLNMEYYRQMNNFDEFKVYAMKYFDQCLLKHQPRNGQEKALIVNRILVAAEFCMWHITDKDLLTRSLDWLKYAIELDSTNDMAQLLQANLLYKTGKVEEAKANLGIMLQNTNTSKANLVNYYREVHKKMYANQRPW